MLSPTPYNLDHLCLADIIVRVKGDRFFSNQDTKGYGIIVNKNGWILTCYHIVSDTEQIIAVTISGKELLMEIFHFDEMFDLVILRPIEETGSFNFVNFEASLKLIKLPCRSFLLDDSFVTFEGRIREKHALPPSLRTVIEIHNDNSANFANFGGPIITPDLDNFLGIVTDPPVVKEKLFSNNCSNNIIFGIVADDINIYLRYVNKKRQEEKDQFRQLSKLEVKVILILQFRANSMQYAVDSRDPASACYKILEQVANDMTKLLQSEHAKIVEEVILLAKKLAPGSVIFEARLCITLKSARQKYEAIRQLCQTLHIRFSDKINPDILSVIDVSSLRVFEDWKWFLEWNTALIVNKSSFRLMTIDSFLIDLLHTHNLFTEEEYVVLSIELLSQKRTNKFIDIIGTRYPSDIDFIVAVLQQQEQGSIADYFKVLKEKAMKMAEPYENVKQRSTEDNSSNTQVSTVAYLNVFIQIYISLLIITFSVWWKKNLLHLNLK